MHFDIPRYVKMHVDDGLELISEVNKGNPNLPIFDFILDLIEEGMESLRNSSL